MQILTISGSHRAASLNTSLIRSLPALSPEHTFTELDYTDIPLYNQDLEAEFPESVVTLKEAIRAADAIIVATPEYNRSIPGPLKNMVDWASRPYGDSAWAGKPVYVMGASVAPTGTTLAQADLRKAFLFLDARVMGQPETFVGVAQEKFAKDGTLTDEALGEHLKKMIGTFATFAGE